MLGLTGVAVAALAGCTESAGSRAEGRRATGSTASASETATRAGAQPSGETATDGTATDGTATAEGTADPATPDESAEAGTDPDVEAARAALGPAYDDLVAQGDGSALTDVTAASYPLRTDEVLAAVERGRMHLEHARAEAAGGEQARTVEDLSVLASFLETVTVGQKNLTRAHWRLDDVPDLFFDGSASTLSDRLDAAVFFAGRAERGLDDLPSDVDTRAARSFDRFDADAVTAKIDGMRAAIEAIDAVHDAFDPAISGLELLRDGTASYDVDRYADAMTAYGDAADEFGAAREEFAGIDPAEPFASTVEGMASAVAVLEPGCNELADAAAAMADGMDTMAERCISEACEGFDTHDDVPSIPAIEDGPGGD